MSKDTSKVIKSVLAKRKVSIKETHIDEGVVDSVKEHLSNALRHAGKVSFHLKRIAKDELHSMMNPVRAKDISEALEEHSKYLRTIRKKKET